MSNFHNKSGGDVVVYTFETTHFAIMAEKILEKRKDLSIEIIPTPRKISASCGIAVKIKKKDMDVVEKALAAYEIEFSRWENPC